MEEGEVGSCGDGSDCSLPLPLGSYHGLVTVADRLVAWFRANARPLPWRTPIRDPYRSLVSELMAQQTQLDRVVTRFEVFVRRFPSLASLAAASEEEVLAAWSGLGYYRRARLLHRLACEVTAAGGELPRTAVELENLPGVGPYTAAALASVVFGEAVPLMDGNVARVGARVLALGRDPRSTRGRSEILRWVASLMNDAPPGEVNEALMELGARICTPMSPQCGRCPLARECRAGLDGRPDAYPRPRRSREAVDLEWLAAVAEADDGRWLLRRVTDGPILRGLWLPPFAERDESKSPALQARELIPVRDLAGFEVAAPIGHAITHRRISVTAVRVALGHRPDLPSGWSFADPEAPGLPTSSLLGKLLTHLRR